MKPTAFFADAKERLSGGFTILALIIGFILSVAGTIFNGWLATEKYESVEFWYEYKDILPAVAQTNDSRVLWFWVIVPGVVALMFAFLAFRALKTLIRGTFFEMMRPPSTSRLVFTALSGAIGLFLYWKLQMSKQSSIEYWRWMEAEYVKQGYSADLIDISDYMEWGVCIATYMFFMVVVIRAIANLIERQHLAR